MTASIEITPAAGPLDATVRPPGSKSLTNRALICAALARGTSTLRGVLESEDTSVMIAGLRSLGIAIDEDSTGTSGASSVAAARFAAPLPNSISPIAAPASAS